MDPWHIIWYSSLQNIISTVYETVLVCTYLYGLYNYNAYISTLAKNRSILSWHFHCSPAVEKSGWRTFVGDAGDRYGGRSSGWVSTARQRPTSRQLSGWASATRRLAVSKAAATLRLGVGSSAAAGRRLGGEWRQGGVWTVATLRLEAEAEADHVTVTIRSLGDGYDP
jgi:hypothetical protein